MWFHSSGHLFLICSHDFCCYSGKVIMLIYFVMSCVYSCFFSLTPTTIIITCISVNVDGLYLCRYWFVISVHKTQQIGENLNIQTPIGNKPTKLKIDLLKKNRKPQKHIYCYFYAQKNRFVLSKIWILLKQLCRFILVPTPRFSILFPLEMYMYIVHVTRSPIQIGIDWNKSDDTLRIVLKIFSL